MRLSRKGRKNCSNLSIKNLTCDFRPVGLRHTKAGFSFTDLDAVGFTVRVMRDEKVEAATGFLLVVVVVVLTVEEDEFLSVNEIRLVLVVVVEAFLLLLVLVAFIARFK